MTRARQRSRTATLARLGFADAARAEQLLDDPALAGLVDPLRRHLQRRPARRPRASRQTRTSRCSASCGSWSRCGPASRSGATSRPAPAPTCAGSSPRCATRGRARPAAGGPRRVHRPRRPPRGPPRALAQRHRGPAAHAVEERMARPRGGRAQPRRAHGIRRPAHRRTGAQLLGIAALDLTSADATRDPARTRPRPSRTWRRRPSRPRWPSPGPRCGEQARPLRLRRSSAWARPAAASSTTSATSTSSSWPSRRTARTRPRRHRAPPRRWRPT